MAWGLSKTMELDRLDRGLGFSRFLVTIGSHEQREHLETSNTYSAKTIGAPRPDQSSHRYAGNRGASDLAFGFVHRFWMDRLSADPLWI